LGYAGQQGLKLTQLYWEKRNSTNPTSNKKKNYHHPTFIQYKKSLINLFSLYHMKNIKK
jgi:hypothetical protein